MCIASNASTNVEKENSKSSLQERDKVVERIHAYRKSIDSGRFGIVSKFWKMKQWREPVFIVFIQW